VRQALQNVVEVLAEAGARPEHIVRMTWYLTDKREYLKRGKEIGAVFRELIGSFNAAMTAVQVVALIEIAPRSRSKSPPSSLIERGTHHGHQGKLPLGRPLPARGPTRRRRTPGA
jgi:enamine deaminase RidA (YjgF/YER057c/UK114 family)